MFRKIPKELKKEYRRYFREHKFLFGFHIFLIAVLCAIAPFEFWSGMRMADEFGGLIFKTLEDADHPLSYAALFVSLIVLEIFLNRVLKRIRAREMFESLHYMEHRFYALPDTPDNERASACKSSFNEMLDAKLDILHTFLLVISLAVFTCLANYYAGPVLIAMLAVNFIRSVKGKEQNKWLRLATNAALQAYFISTIILMIFHVISYGGILAYYCSILVKNNMEKDMVEDTDKIKMQLSRFETLALAFAEREPAANVPGGDIPGEEEKAAAEQSAEVGTEDANTAPSPAEEERSAPGEETETPGAEIAKEAEKDAGSAAETPESPVASS